MAEIRSPNPNFTGVRRGVEFVRGVGHTGDRDALDELARRGYTVLDDEPETAEPPRHGRGSGRDAWLAFAVAATGAPESTWAALSRDEIVETLESEGVIEASS